MVNVQAAPQIVFSEFPAGFCLSSSSFQLDASPLGGIFSGPGISGDLFIPANAGEGTHEITYLLDDGVCAVDSSFELLVEECVSVDATTSNDQINLYPNPTSDWIHIDGLKDEMEISILNLQGQIVVRLKFQDSTTKINIENYASGVYFLQWQSEEGMQSRKFIVEH